MYIVKAIQMNISAPPVNILNIIIYALECINIVKAITICINGKEFLSS